MRDTIKFVNKRIKFCRLLIADPRCPRRAKLLLGAAAAYAVSPIDLIPDFIPVLGHLDDVLILPLLLWLGLTMVPKELIRELREQVEYENAQAPDETVADSNVAMDNDNSSGNRLWFCGILLLIVYFTLFHLGATDFWGNIAESRRAQISREMLDPGANILVPTLNGEPILTKPPLFYWLQAASYRLTGVVDSASARLPSAIAAMMMLAAIFLVGKRVRDGVTGVLAIGMTAATVLYVNYSRSAEMDMVFSALITVSMAFLFVDMNVESGLEQKRWPIMGFWLFCGLAFMVKGPFALLFPLAAVAAFAGIAKEWRPLRRFLYIPGMVVFVMLIVPYYVYLLRYSDGAAQVIGRETLGRFADGAAHGEPFYILSGKINGFHALVAFASVCASICLAKASARRFVHRLHNWRFIACRFRCAVQEERVYAAALSLDGAVVRGLAGAPFIAIVSSSKVWGLVFEAFDGAGICFGAGNGGDFCMAECGNAAIDGHDYRRRIADCIYSRIAQASNPCGDQQKRDCRIAIDHVFGVSFFYAHAK
jgi:uncharacterized membrane protein YkvA (DUF1232 family)